MGQFPNPATQFSSSNQPEKNGRPKKIYTIIKESGFSLDDMREAFKDIGWQTLEDAQVLVDDPKSPLIVKVIAQAFIKGATKGDFRYIDNIIQHAIGKPKETQDIKTDNKHEITVKFEQRNNPTGTAPDAIEGA